MKSYKLDSKAHYYLETLCGVKPHRRTGSPGNREAADFFAGVVRPFGYSVDTTPFECLDHVTGEVLLARGHELFEVHINPYSLGCDVTAELVTASTIDELASVDCRARILLLRSDICAEQLMPKNFVFYNPEQHQEIIALLEERGPAAIVTATGSNPDLVGALAPFPLINDGDFDIPGVYCTDTIGEQLANPAGEVFRLKIEASRLPSSANNIIARLNENAKEKIVITAHIDVYGDTPGASDNASGTAVLLLLAELLADYEGEYGIEIAAFNGEDHYSAGGEMDYLRRYGHDLPNICLLINVDDVGYIQGGSAYSFYGCPPPIEQQARGVFSRYGGLLSGEPWFNGDHMVFVQKQIPSIAFTAECMGELMRTITHTPADTPDLIDPDKLVELAQAINALVRSL